MKEEWIGWEGAEVRRGSDWKKRREGKLWLECKINNIFKKRLYFELPLERSLT